MRQAGVDEREELLLEQLDVVCAAEARLFAERADLLVDLAARSRRLYGADGVERHLAGDLAGTLRVGLQAAGMRLADAERLHGCLTRTLAGLRAGSVLVPQALLLLEETRRCDEPVAADAERRVFTGLGPDGLGPWIGGRLRRRVKRCVLAAEADLQPQATAQREADARAQRRVTVRPQPDAMVSLWALLPAEQARAFTLGLDELARRQRLADRSAGIERTADQRRADLLALLPALALHALDGTAPTQDGSHPAVVVHVHVPMATALGLTDAPGHLDGYGPVSAGTVRLMLPHARLRKVVVDALTGEPVHVAARTSRAATTSGATGPALPAASAATAATARPAASAASTATATAATTPAGLLAHGALRQALLGMLDDRPLLVQDVPEGRYPPSAGLDRLVRLRDGHCTGVGCDQPAALCDLDHRNPWPLGPTSAGNLAPLSRRCHRAKTASWTLRRARDGSTTWTSPTRRTYRSPSPWDPPPDPDAYRPRALPDDVQLPSEDGEPADRDDSELTARLEPLGRAAARPAAAPGPFATQDDPPPF